MKIFVVNNILLTFFTLFKIIEAFLKMTWNFIQDKENQTFFRA